MSAFMITPIGLAIIALYSFAIGAVTLLLSRLLKNLRWRWWLLAPPTLLLMALPWAEEAWIAWHFNQACKDAGVKVYRTVEVEGFYDGTQSTAFHYIDKYGFRFMEQQEDNGKILHVEGMMGNWTKIVLDSPSARYRLVYRYQPTPYRIEEPIGWRLQKMERQVIDSQTGEILGRDTIIKRRYSMADAVWIGLFGSYPKLCPGPQSPLSTPQPPFPQSVLKPASHS